MFYDRFVDINTHLNSFGGCRSKIMDVICRRLMGLYDVTVSGGLPVL